MKRRKGPRPNPTASLRFSSMVERHRRNSASTSPPKFTQTQQWWKGPRSRSKGISSVFCRHRGKQASTNFQIQSLSSSACRLLATRSPNPPQLSNSTHTSFSSPPDPAFELLPALAAPAGSRRPPSQPASNSSPIRTCGTRPSRVITKLLY